VDSSEPGAKIEVNYQFVGGTPTTIKIFGDRDGTFHNFGSDEFIVRAYPPRASQYPQTKIFKTGAFGIQDDKIPQKIFFDFGRPTKSPNEMPINHSIPQSRLLMKRIIVLAAVRQLCC